jgi:DNA-binding NarL/FixJ family response regulator
MDRPLTVLLVEDDQAECKLYEQYMDDLEDIRLVDSTDSAETALQHTADYLPDVIILDLELHKGGGDGVTFLEALKKADLSYLPYILVATNNEHPVTHAHIRRLGVGFIMVKSQAGYSVGSIVEFLRSAKKVIQDARSKSSAPEIKESPADKEKRLLKQVSAEIDLVGINPKVVGRKYLVDAILMLIEGQTKNHISAIAQKYGKTDASVERAMQNAINSAWRSVDIDHLGRCYTARISSEKGVPTLTEFVFHYVNKIQVS